MKTLPYWLLSLAVVAADQISKFAVLERFALYERLNVRISSARERRRKGNLLRLPGGKRDSIFLKFLRQGLKFKKFISKREQKFCRQLASRTEHAK